MMIVLIVDFLIIAFFLAADLVSKHYAAKALAGGGYYEAIEKVLTFQYVENDGAAFGMLSNARVLLCVFVGIVLLGLTGFLVFHAIKKKYKEKGGILLHVALSLVISGGLGNLVDRIALGYVRDFIDYTILYTLFKIDFAICNGADVVLTVGITLLVIYLIIYLVEDAKKTKQKKLAESAATLSETKEEGSVKSDPALPEEPSGEEIPADGEDSGEKE